MRKASIGVALTLGLVSGVASAADLKVLTVGGLQKPITLIAADFEKAGGAHVVFTFTNPAELEKTLSGSVYDVIVVADAPVTALEKAGKIAAGTHAKIVRGGIGVALKEGSKFPDISTPDALKAALASAKSIAYTDPATPNGSGEKTKAILEGLGIWDGVVAKGKKMGLGPGKEAVAKGEVEMGLFNASESEAPGCVLAGLVPMSIQRYTNYDAGVTSGAGNSAAAAEFVKFMTGMSAVARWNAGHMSPMGG